jgi:hypothetical protein
MMVHGVTSTLNNTYIEGNGHEIMVMDGGRLDWSNVTVNNVSRIMFHECAGVQELTNVTISNSGQRGVFGFYPLHFHLNGDCTRGTVLDNVTVINGQNHAFVPHGSHGISILNSTAFNTIDDAVWWDPDNGKTDTTNNTHDLTIDNLLIDGVRPNSGRGIQLTGVKLETGTGNSITNSVVRNVHGDKNCSAYHWPESANQNVGGTVWRFENNVGTSDCHGIFVWQNDGGNHIVTNFSGDGVQHGAYSNVYQYIDLDVPYFDAHAQGFTVRGGSVGQVFGSSGRFEGDVRFIDVEVTGFRVQNATDKPAPVHYFFTNTGLTCGEIVWANWKPGTTVRIDGVMCPVGG